MKNFIILLSAIFMLLYVSTFSVIAGVPICKLAVTISKIKTNCYGSCDGKLTANPSKGTLPYSYVWSNGATTKQISGLCKGSYTVTVYDGAGCSKIIIATVTSPPVVKITVVQTNVKCKGECNGSLTASASGGSGSGYKYRWSNHSTLACINNLCKGTYTLTVTDSKGCTAKITKTITEPAKLLALSTSKSSCSICNPCNGKVTANPTGGIAPYHYEWSTGGTTRTLIGLCPDTYTVTVTDKNGCVKSCQATIPGSCCNIDLTLSSTENTKCKPCNGTASVLATGGSNYLYIWSSGATTEIAEGLCAGEYHVTVSSPGCAAVTDTIIVEEIITPADTPVISGNSTFIAGDSTTLNTALIPGAIYCWENLSNGDWDTVGFTGFSGILTSFTSLAFNSIGIPYVAFQDGFNGPNTVMKFEGGAWSNVGSAGFGGSSSDQSLAFDGDTAYLAYTHNDLGGYACVRKFDGINWVPVGPLDFSLGSVQYTSLAINNGIPYVAFEDYGNSNAATVMKFNGSEWDTVGIAGFSIVEASSTKLVFHNNTPYVAFVDITNSSKTSVMKFDGTDWVAVGAVDFSEGSANFLSLAFDGDIPYLAYQDNFNGDKTTVMKFDGGNWVNVGSAGFTPNVAYHQSLAISNGTPYVAFLDGDNGDKTSVMKFNGSDWVYVGAAGFSNSLAFYQSAAFNGTELYVAFVDGAYENRVTVMKRQTCISDADSLVVTEAGTYVVTVTNENGCTATSQPFIVSEITEPPGITVVDGCNLPCCSASLTIKGIDESQIVSVHWEVDQLSDEYDLRSCFDISFIDITNTDTVLNNICSGDYKVTVYLLNGDSLIYEGTIVSGTISPFLYTVYISCYNDCTGDVFSLSGFAQDVSLVDANGNSMFGVMCPDTNYIYTSLDIFGCEETTNVSVPNVPQLVADCIYIEDIQEQEATLSDLTSGGTPPYSYLWSTGQTDESVIVPLPSPYSVTVTDYFGCVATSTCLNGNSKLAPHVKAIAKNIYSIFPNPFTEGFTIKYSGDDEFKVTVTDPRGSIVYSGSGLSKQAEIGRTLAPGIYLVAIESTYGYRAYQKVIKTQ